MMRWLYRCLLRLHPAPFRERYAAEMLGIFDEAGGVASFMADGVVSLARQWLLRSSAWTMAAGGVSAFVLIGGMLSMAAFPPRFVYGPAFDESEPPLQATAAPPAQFDGHWAGYFQFPWPAGLIEFTLRQNHGLWSGDLQMHGADGAVHPGVAEDIRVGGDSLSFHFKAAGGDMTFHGRMIQGKLQGSVHPTGAAYF